MDETASVTAGRPTEPTGSAGENAAQSKSGTDADIEKHRLTVALVISISGFVLFLFVALIIWGAGYTAEGAVGVLGVVGTLVSGIIGVIIGNHVGSEGKRNAEDRADRAQSQAHQAEKDKLRVEHKASQLKHAVHHERQHAEAAANVPAKNALDEIAVVADRLFPDGS